MGYWAGQHRRLSRGVEFGFVVGNGIHWWCIRPCGKDLEEWEEVDSMGGSHIARWSAIDDLLESLMARLETVLVLYPLPRDEDESLREEKEDMQDGMVKLSRASKKAELKAALKRQKEERRAARHERIMSKQISCKGDNHRNETERP